jgi:hypothetical protein
VTNANQRILLGSAQLYSHAIVVGAAVSTWCQAARNRYAHSGGRDLTKSTPYVSVATSAATAAVSWAQARHGFDVALAHDEATSLWRNILALAPHFAPQNGTGFRAKHATDFVRAQKADSEGHVSGTWERCRCRIEQISVCRYYEVSSAKIACANISRAVRVVGFSHSAAERGTLDVAPSPALQPLRLPQNDCPATRLALALALSALQRPALRCAAAAVAAAAARGGEGRLRPHGLGSGGNGDGDER